MKLRLNNLISNIRYAGVTLDEFEVRSMPIDELYSPVRSVPSFVNEIKESIDLDGLINPVIVVRKPREDILADWARVQIDPIPPDFPDTPVVNVVWGGTNRLHAARELGYTHVDCVLMPDFALAFKVQASHRNSYVDARKFPDA